MNWGLLILIILLLQLILMLVVLREITGLLRDIAQEKRFREDIEDIEESQGGSNRRIEKTTKEK